ncbi:MAG TPA: methyl-accepting chemotaxis protein [Terriglobales bacterium]|nr:methyl-accepting chemotaxis protein [Terriglobales bacterium]
MKNLKFRTKLFLLTGIAVLGLLILGIMSYTTLERVKIGGPIYNEMRTVFDLDADLTPPILNIMQFRLLARQMILETDRDKVQQSVAKFQQLKQDYKDANDKYVKLLPDGQIKDLLVQKARPAGEAYLQEMEQELIPAALKGERKKAEAALASMQEVGNANYAATAEAEKLAQELITSKVKEAGSTVSTRIVILIITAIGAGVIVALLGIIIGASILGPLNKTMYVLQALAEGDLRQHVEVASTDEIGVMGQALNKAIDGMSQTIQSIASTAEHVASASEEISSAANQQSQGAEIQKGQTDQVATAMQEMSSTVLQVSENSNKAADASREAAETARKGGSIVEDTLSKMRVIATSVESTAQKMEGLGKSSDQIGRIAGVIDDIADQTNLLALNAAIEAARAGEQGRGFAVVADEVRKLAERTTTATKEIAQMIKNIQDETKSAVTAMEAGTKQVEDGVKSTSQAGDALKEIISMSEHVGEMITHIATAATEQSSASEEINNNIEQIAKLVKEASDGSQQSAKACQDLSGLALDLQNMVSNFKLNENEPQSQQRPERKSLSQNRQNHLLRPYADKRPGKTLAARAGH